MSIDERLEGLFRRGSYLQVAGEFERAVSSPESVGPKTKLLVAHALAIVGDFTNAKRLATLPDACRSLELVARSRLVLGLTEERTGHLDSALEFYESALTLLSDSRDEATLRAWVALHRFRLLVEGHPRTALTSMMPGLRKLVHRAGDPQVSAYLHMCTAVLEGETGDFEEAMRHCEVANSLLQISENASLRASNLVTQGCIAVLEGRISEGTHSFEEAGRLSSANGDRSVASAVSINLAHISLLTGRLTRAHELFGQILRSGAVGKLTEIGALDGLARVRLVENDLPACGAALQSVEAHRSKHALLPSIYLVRWAGLTKARLQLREGKPLEAVALLDRLVHDTASVRDQPFALALASTLAVAYHRLGDTSQSAYLALSATRSAPPNHELRPQRAFIESIISADSDNRLSRQLHQRALRVWEAQGVVSMRVELDDQGIDIDTARRELKAARTTPAPTPRSPATVTNAIAAVIDLAYSPRLAAIELLALVRGLDCSPGARLVESPDDPPQGGPRDAVCVLGTEAGTTYALLCPVPPDPARAVVLGDILRLAQAGTALEAARRQERSRTALWPANPVEEQAGALFASEEMQELLAAVRRFAATDIPVLITGETGTGKEVLARTIHGYSSRASRQFVPFNCSATPRDMLDAQLFGHRKGAFTGATEHFPGVIRGASGGTLFLDEIGETTLDLQPKLLRFLEAGEVHPIGEAQPTRVSVRVIAATNADIESLVAQGRFRDDLFYRLNIIRLHVPPLRARREEIPVLAQHYLDKCSLETGKHGLRLADETIEYLVLYKWPGNVRQLANEMRRMVALADNGAVLMPEHLSPPLAASRRTLPPSERPLEPTEVVVRLDQPLPAATAHLERAMILHAMRMCHGRLEDTAALLGVSRKGLYLKRQRLGLEFSAHPEGAAAV